MLVLRNEQLAAMAASTKDEAVRANVRLVQEEAPRRAAATSEGELRALVQAAMARAGTLGITRAWDVARFALLEAIYGPGFHTREAWAAAVFSREGPSPTEKMDALEQTFRNYLAKGLG